MTGKLMINHDTQAIHVRDIEVLLNSLAPSVIYSHNLRKTDWTQIRPDKKHRPDLDPI